MTIDKAIAQIIAEALVILEAKVKTAEDIMRLYRLSQDLDKILRKGG